MEGFITAITGALSGVFTAITNAFASVGDLIFVSGEAGAVTGVTSFGYVLAVIVGIPLATWLLNKALGLFKGLNKK